MIWAARQGYTRGDIALHRRWGSCSVPQSFLKFPRSGPVTGCWGETQGVRRSWWSSRRKVYVRTPKQATLAQFHRGDFAFVFDNCRTTLLAGKRRREARQWNRWLGFGLGPCEVPRQRSRSGCDRQGRQTTNSRMIQMLAARIDMM